MKKSRFFSVVMAVCCSLNLLEATPPIEVSEQHVVGTNSGNHTVDCTIIRPWSETTGPAAGVQYPVIVWANGWGFNNVVGEEITNGYKPGLIEWAKDGRYIIVAANQWSVQESDILECLQWIVDQNSTAGSEYEGVVNTAKIGLAGHSQGGGAAIKAGDGEPNGFQITAVVAMNPYGPSWVNPGNQDGPVLLIGGTNDTTTPVSSFFAVWEAIQTNGIGGALAILEDGTHNDDAWAPEDDSDNPQNYDFGRYQRITELWWQFHLNDNTNKGRQLKRELEKAPWLTEFAFTPNFQL